MRALVAHFLVLDVRPLPPDHNRADQQRYRNGKLHHHKTLPKNGTRPAPPRGAARAAQDLYRLKTGQQHRRVHARQQYSSRQHSAGQKPKQGAAPRKHKRSARQFGKPRQGHLHKQQGQQACATGKHRRLTQKLGKQLSPTATHRLSDTCFAGTGLCASGGEAHVIDSGHEQDEQPHHRKNGHGTAAALVEVVVLEAGVEVQVGECAKVQGDV